MRILAILSLLLLACDSTPETSSCDVPVHTLRDMVEILCAARCDRRAACGVVEVGCEYGCETRACAEIGEDGCDALLVSDWPAVEESVKAQATLACGKATPEI